MYAALDLVACSRAGRGDMSAAKSKKRGCWLKVE